MVDLHAETISYKERLMFYKKCFTNVLDNSTNSYKEGQPLIFAALSSGSGASGVRLSSFL